MIVKQRLETRLGVVTEFVELQSVCVCDIEFQSIKATTSVMSDRDLARFKDSKTIRKEAKQQPIK